MMSLEVSDDPERRMRLRKQIKDELHGSAHLFVRIERDLACGVIDESDGQTKA
jgi:hypothetical protein